jgi:hypothetical protein
MPRLALLDVNAHDASQNSAAPPALVFEFCSPTAAAVGLRLAVGATRLG